MAYTEQPISHVYAQKAEDIMGNPMSFAPYKEAFREIASHLIPGMPIPPDIRINLIGKKRLSKTELKFTNRDRRPLNDITFPGKSASIAHTTDVRIACLTMLNRQVQDKDALYSVTQKELQQIGFTAYYAPTQHHPLHVRFIPNELDITGNIPQKLLVDLMHLLQQNKVRQKNSRRTV